MKTMKRAGIAAAVMVGVAVLAGVWVLTKDVVVPRNDKGDLDFGKIEARDQEKDQPFAFLGRDINQIDVTVREVDYGALPTGDETPEQPPAADARPDGKAGADDEPAQREVPEKKLGLARVDGKWTLTAPVHGRADQGAADGMATAIAELRVKGREADVDPLDTKYGLNNPCVVVNVGRRGGKTTRILIGRDAPVGSDVYLMIEGERALYYASSSVKTSFIKEPKELRDKKVTQFERDDVKVLVLDAGGGRIVCEQTGKRDAREWWLTQPAEARADNFSVDDVLDAVKNLEAKDFVDNVSSLSAYGLDKPTVTARLDFGKDTDDIVVKLGRRTKQTIADPSTTPGADTAPKDLIYCMTEGRDEVFLVDAEIDKKLNKKPIELRDTTIVDYETSKVTRIAIRRKGKPDIELVKADAKWSLQKPEFANADFSEVDNFLWSLKDIEAVEFLDDKPVNASVSGLNNPEVAVTLTLEGQDTPIELKIGYLHQNRKGHYFQASTASGIVLVGADALEKIPTSPDKLKEKQDETTPPASGAAKDAGVPMPPEITKSK
jgi:hypothetical protein